MQLPDQLSFLPCRITSLALVLAAALFAAPVPVSAQTPQNLNARPVLSSPELIWSTDPSAVQATSFTEGRPMILYFNSPVVFACRDMEQKTFRDQAVVDVMKRYNLAVVDITESPEMRLSLQILKVPAVIVYSPKGEELFRAVGYKTPTEFRDYLSALPLPPERPKPEDKLATPPPPLELTANSLAFDPSKLVLRPRRGARPVRFLIYAPTASTATIVGDFSDWHDDRLPLTRDASGYWWTELHLQDGLYEYLFQVDGERIPDPNAKFQRPSEEDLRVQISRILVGEQKYPIVRNGQVTFIHYNRLARQVHIAGSFNGWVRTPMFSNGDGNWGITYPLGPGSYEYAFAVDKEPLQWDDANPLVAQGPGTKGGSIVVVPAN